LKILIIHLLLSKFHSFHNMAAGSVPPWKRAGQSPFAFFSWQICHALDAGTSPARRAGENSMSYFAGFLSKDLWTSGG
jgi:hypothetical protein